jgi:pentatricopeptide repeat protein
MSNKVNKAGEFYNFCVKSGYEIDNFGQGLMLNCFVKEGHLLSATNFFDQIHNPDIVMLNTLVDGLCNAGSVNDVYALYVTMSEKHLIHGDAYTFNSLINS